MIFHWGQVKGRRTASPSPPAKGTGGGSAVSSPAGFGAESRPPKGFPLFSALRMASPDTIMLLIVDYHAAVGGKTPVAPLRTTLTCE